jgi:hypothetical protein
MVSMLDDKQIEGIEAFNDLAAHIAQAVVSARVREDGLVVTADLVTFAADPPAARAAYHAALAARTAGDVKGWHRRLAELEKKYPNTYAARRAADVRTSGPYFGAGMVFLGGMGQSAQRAKKPEP